VLAGSTAYIVSHYQEPVFEATTTLLINEAPTAQTSEYSAILMSERLARTYAEMLTKRPVLEVVFEKFDLGSNYEDLGGFQEAITVSPVRDTQLVDLSVEGLHPVQVAQIANALVDVFIEQNEEMQASRYAESKASLEEQLVHVDGEINNITAGINEIGYDINRKAEKQRLNLELVQFQQIYSELLQSYEEIRVAEAQATSNVVKVEPAIPPENPIRPRVLMNTALAGVVGAMLAVGAIFLMEALDDTFKSPEDITRHLKLPVIGTILTHKTDNDGPVTVEEPRSPTAEAFRSLRTNIHYANVDEPLQTLMITSPTAQEGKTTVAANLAIVMAQGGTTICLVDSDMRRPRLHKRLNLPNTTGLSSLFVIKDLFKKNQGLPDGSYQKTTTDGMHVITSGKRPPNPSELLASQKMGTILEHLRGTVDIILVDTPPVLAVTDSTVLAPKVDGVLLVIKPGETKIEAGRQAALQLKRVGANIIGVVLNGVNPKSSRYGYYYRYEYYDTRADEDEAKSPIKKLFTIGRKNKP